GGAGLRRRHRPRPGPDHAEPAPARQRAGGPAGARGGGAGATAPRARRAALALAHAPVVLGWARPVPLNRANFRHPQDAAVWVALAGPASNALFAVLAAVSPATGAFAPLRQMAIVAVVLNLVLVLF